MIVKNSNTQRRPNWRRPGATGFSLVELIVSMTGGAAVFCLAIATIEQTMKLSSQSRARAEHQLTVARLGQQFRSDVHQVREFRLQADNRVTSPSATGGGRIEPFRRDPGGGGLRSEPVDFGRQRSKPAGASPGSPQLFAGQPSMQVSFTTYQSSNESAAANDAPSRTGASTLRLTTEAELTITYTVIGSTVTREVTKAGSSTVSRETYRLHKECSVRLESSDDEHVTLLVVRQPPDGGELLENRIVAHVGRLFFLQSLRKGQ